MLPILFFTDFFTNFQVLEAATACIYDPLSDLWLLTLVTYEKWLLSLQKIDLKKKK
jgi:hypothetical protein